MWSAKCIVLHCSCNGNNTISRSMFSYCSLFQAEVSGLNLFMQPSIYYYLVTFVHKCCNWRQKSKKLLLQTVRRIIFSKFPEGNVEMWHVYVAPSDSFVLTISSVESLKGSALSKRMWPPKPWNSRQTDRRRGNTILEHRLPNTISTRDPLS